MNNNTLVQFFKLTENDKNNLPLKEGQIIFTTDTHKLFLDINDSTRIQIQGIDYTAGTGLNLSGTEFSNAGVRSITTGSTNGTINIDTNGIAAEVAVAGLGSLAYKSSLTASEVGAIDSTLKGASNGVAELDSTGKVPSSQLPSYVDDVLEYPTEGDFPATGETGKIYVDMTTNKTYRWGGSSYVVISETLALGETSSTAYRGDRGKTAYDHASDSNKISSATATGLYKVGATAEGHVSGLTAVTKSDITALGILDDITISPVANTGSSIGTITVDNTTYDFKLPAQVGNEVRIGSTQPQDNNWKLWVDSDEISNQASEITNSYSESTGIGYSANYTNDKLVKVGTTNDDNFKVNFTKGKNLFDKNNRNVVNLYPSSTGTLQNNSYKSLLIEIEPNTTYTFTSLNAYSDGISLGTYTSIPTTSLAPTNRVGVTATENHGTITSGASDRFLLAYVKWSSSALTENELNGIMLEKGSTQSPYQPYVTPTINVDGEEIYNKNRLDNAFIEQPYNQQDFNNYTIPGSYMINNTSLSNIPVSAPGVLMVWVGNYSTPGTKYIAQLYISNQGAHSRFRDTGATQWSAWKQLHN